MVNQTLQTFNTFMSYSKPKNKSDNPLNKSLVPSYLQSGKNNLMQGRNLIIERLKQKEQQIAAQEKY